MKVNSKKDGEFEKLYFMKSSRWWNVTALSHYIDQEEDYNIAHFSFWFESGPARVMIAVTERDPGGETWAAALSASSYDVVMPISIVETIFRQFNQNG